MMSVLNRVRRAQQQTDTPKDGDPRSTDQSSIPADSEVAKRIKLVAEELIGYVEKKGDESPFTGHMWFIKSIFQIFFEEMNGKDDEKLAMWIRQFGMLLEWCGTGDDSKLPPGVADYLRRFHPEYLPMLEAAAEKANALQIMKH